MSHHITLVDGGVVCEVILQERNFSLEASEREQS